MPDSILSVTNPLRICCNITATCGRSCRPVVVDTPELRAQYIREMLLSALELDGSL
jgi:hypothetical protein